MSLHLQHFSLSAFLSYLVPQEPYLRVVAHAAISTVPAGRTLARKNADEPTVDINLLEGTGQFIVQLFFPQFDLLHGLHDFNNLGPDLFASPDACFLHNRDLLIDVLSLKLLTLFELRNESLQSQRQLFGNLRNAPVNNRLQVELVKL